MFSHYYSAKHSVRTKCLHILTVPNITYLHSECIADDSDDASYHDSDDDDDDCDDDSANNSDADNDDDSDGDEPTDDDRVMIMLSVPQLHTTLPVLT